MAKNKELSFDENGIIIFTDEKGKSEEVGKLGPRDELSEKGLLEATEATHTSDFGDAMKLLRNGVWLGYGGEPAPIDPDEDADLLPPLIS